MKNINIIIFSVLIVFCTVLIFQQKIVAQAIAMDKMSPVPTNVYCIGGVNCNASPTPQNSAMQSPVNATNLTGKMATGSSMKTATRSGTASISGFPTLKISGTPTKDQRDTLHKIIDQIEKLIENLEKNAADTLHKQLDLLEKQIEAFEKKLLSGGK